MESSIIPPIFLPFKFDRICKSSRVSELWNVALESHLIKTRAAEVLSCAKFSFKPINLRVESCLVNDGRSMYLTKET